MATAKLTPALKERLDAVSSIITDQTVKKNFISAFTKSKGNLTDIKTSLAKKVPPAELAKIELAHSVASIANNDETAVKTVHSLPGVKNLRDLALNHNATSLSDAIKKEMPHAQKTDDELNAGANAIAATMMKNLFHKETSAVLQGMAGRNELPITNANIKSGVNSFLANQPEFNIRTASIYDALKNKDALKNIDPQHQGEVISTMKDLQRVQAISPDPGTLGNLMSSNLLSAHKVTEMPQKNFIKTFGDKLGEDNAKLVYANAAKIRTRNELVLGQLKDAGTTTNTRILSNGLSQEAMADVFNAAADTAGVNLSWETLFGSTDMCECVDCNSVYSPAAYFVELLQYLRNNNLKSPGSATDITGTVLEKFFLRRPDLGCLELTCENVNTVLPYIDLVNEVLESFIVHTHDSTGFTVTETGTETDIAGNVLEIWNTEDETTIELLAQPQHTNYKAYCILKHEVYPFTLPYHQPIDAIRIFLNSINTSRYELMKTFQSIPMNMPVPLAGNPAFTDDQKTQLVQFIEKGLKNATDAEYLNLTEEEYVILTKNTFKEIGYYNIVCNKTFSTNEYETQVGVKPVTAYYGYTNTTTPTAAEDDMNNQLNPEIGLKFVKKQFLKRTGILYTDLIDILKTQFINPCYPQGKALTIMDSLRFSYSYLKSLVVNDLDPKKKFANLLSTLEQPNPAVGWLSNILNPDECHKNDTENNISSDDLKQWVYCNFERIGKLIVLDANDAPYFPIYGYLYCGIVSQQDSSLLFRAKLIGTISREGIITDPDKKNIGQINFPDGAVNFTNFKSTDVCQPGEAFAIPEGQGFWIFDNQLAPGPDDEAESFDRSRAALLGSISLNDSGQLFVYSLFSTDPITPVMFMPAPDSCDITKVTIQHLDGTMLEDCEWDNIHRFIRLWHKLGWTINETDKAIMALGCIPPAPDNNNPNPGNSSSDCFSEFKDDCNSNTNTGNCKCDEHMNAGNGNCGNCDISQQLIHQLVYIKKLIDSTGLELVKLLTFWNNISTYGDKKTRSLYARLFLSANMLGVDTIFKADNNGNYLATPQKISDHIPVLMAAFNIKAEDITNILKIAAIDPDDPNSLTLKNVTILYRYSLLMKILSVKSYQLAPIVSDTLFGDPFTDARTTYQFLKNWGKMVDAGFDYAQLNYVINDSDDNKKPLTPKLKTILQLAKNIYDGLNKIDTDNPDSANPADINDDLIRKSIAQLYGTTVVEQIISFLDGTTVYTTNAPLINDPAKQAAFDQALAANADLKTKIKYDYNAGQLQVTGILTTLQITAANALSPDPKWPDAIHRAGNQAILFYNDILDIIFQPPYLPGTDQSADARTIMLAGDDQSLATPSADAKRQYFEITFLPYLRQQLDIKFLISTLSDSLSSSNDVTKSLTQNILVDSSLNSPIIETFKAIKNKPATGIMGWSGYLIPNADDVYTFVITGNPDGTKPVNPFTIDGVSYNISLNAQGDPSNLWFSDPVKLKNGKPYVFTLNGLLADMSQIKWKTSTSPASAMPASVLLPDCSDTVKKAYVQLQKATIIINGFNLNGDEVDYVQQNGADFESLDFNKFTFKPFFRLEAYCRLKKSLPATDTNLISFFTWAKTPGSDATKLSAKINELTQWVQSDSPAPNDIDKLIAANHFNLTIKDFWNEKKFLKLQKALYVSGKISMDINLLFTWAIPTSKFWVCHSIAESIQKTMKARYKETDWEQVVKPLNDKLRVDMRDALVSYLLVEPRLVEWGVVDADSLFEFFVIDAEMDSCMETSRIKQAINSVQLFVQRCFLGLEKQYGVDSDILDRGRWNWMQREVLWVANRKVFLYPENWIEESLRDDKSPFYKELESALLQKDINTQTVEDALKNYLYKLDEVANMKVAGLYVETANPNGHNRIHVFSRTRNAPYFFYYRIYDIDLAVWTAWEKIQIDIPSYDVEDPASHRITGNGCYLAPFVLDNRAMVFFPQIMKKTRPADNSNTHTFDAGVTISNPIDYWEIKMAWSEYRNGKWTQKQLSKEAIYDEYTMNLDGPNIDHFAFVPSLFTPTNEIIVCVYKWRFNVSNQFFEGQFTFSGNNIMAGGPENVVDAAPFPGDFITSFPSSFQYFDNTIFSLQGISTSPDDLELDFVNSTEDLVTETDPGKKVDISYPANHDMPFYHPYSHQLLGKINDDDLIEFFECNPNTPSNFISKTNSPDANFSPQQMFGSTTDEAGNSIFDELKAPYSIYNWELFFHLPLSLAESLSKSQQFENAMKWYHYIFNPIIEAGTDDKRWWRFVPFQNTDSLSYLTTLFNSLKPNTPDTQITQWRDDPFNPHAIARLRPSAYMKKTVMSYLDNLIAWGDYLFTQHTIESINQATQLYIFASHILGKRPQVIPKRGKIKPETYNSLLYKWDAFSNAVVELELVFPFSNQIAEPFEIDPSDGEQVFPNIFGFASSLYFCIPGNPELIAYWDTIDDRLYKIRHCENIEGVFGLPPLWDPPIDPALLVQATAAGLSLDSVLNDLSSPLPNYRFNYLVSKALELCSELKSMGNSLLSIFEKQDGEALSKMRARHEVAVNNLVMEVKKKQVDEASSALEGLNQNRLGPLYRMQHFVSLLGEDSGKIPVNPDSNFSPLTDAIETISGDSGLKLIPYEKEEMDRASDAQDWQKDIGIIETIASILHLIPHFAADVKPIGIGAGFAFGGMELGVAMEAVAKGLQIKSGELSYQSSQAQRKSGFLRQMQDRVLQANNAGFEIKQIDKQILSQQIRIDIANQEITNQQQVIDNSNEVLEFLTNKYTNEELYGWMQDNIKSLYYQVYKLGYDLAKKAEKIYCFERGLTTTNFIQFGYWDAGHDGLLAGERLYVGLKQLESAFQEKRGYDYEITKHISLRQINPLALLQLRENGICEFELPEILFDMDFPGHYMRKIKSVSVSVPCIVGPYAGVNATLRMLENKFRLSSLTNGKDFAETTDQDDPRFTTVNVPITAIATSSAQNDSGMFELNFKDERYMPFEGAGVISKWRLGLPKDFRQFDYETITDVVIHVRYTSIEGGDKLKEAANNSLGDYLKGAIELGDDDGLFGVFDLKHDYPNEWYKIFEMTPGATGRVMVLGNLLPRLPFFTKMFTVKAKDVFMASTGTNGNDWTLVNKTNELGQFSGPVSPPINPLNLFHLDTPDETMDNWSLKLGDTVTEPAQMWIMVRYTLSKKA